MRNPTNVPASGHTNSAPALARSGRLLPEDLLLDTEARAVWRTVTEDKSVLRRITGGPMRWTIYRLRKEDHRSCPLELTARLIVWLANAGASEAMLRLIPLYLERVIENCFAGKAQRTLDEIDRDEQQIEHRENELALERRIAITPTPASLEAEAAINEQEAAVSIERARALRRKARTVLAFPPRPAVT
jgi:hypothetical protein